MAGASQAAFNAEEFPSFWDGIWWAVMTVTTVGYGDLYPTDVEGRLIGIVVMLLGIGFLAVLTATIASQFIKTEPAATRCWRRYGRIETEMADLKARLPADMADMEPRLSSA